MENIDELEEWCRENKIKYWRGKHRWHSTFHDGYIKISYSTDITRINSTWLSKIKQEIQGR